jgi:hypothetical protein
VIYAKLAAVLVAVVSLFSAGWYFSGLRGAKALEAAQARYAQSAAAQAQAALVALNQARAKEQATANRNDGVVRDLQSQIDVADAHGTVLATRLRDALASADRARTVSEDSDQRAATAGAALAASQSRIDAITRATAAYDSACQRDAANYAALIAEITPQL